jgi:hypothetical protein
MAVMVVVRRMELFRLWCRRLVRFVDRRRLFLLLQQFREKLEALVLLKDVQLRRLLLRLLLETQRPRFAHLGDVIPTGKEVTRVVVEELVAKVERQARKMDLVVKGPRRHQGLRMKAPGCIRQVYCQLSQP